MQKIMMLIAVTSALTLAGCGSVVQGVVRDKPTGNPISSASVAIGNEATVTNAMGAYELNASVKPSSTLLINAPGYFLYTESLGDKLIHDIELVPRTQGE
jgi:uncharacterized protein YceK